MSRAFGGLRGAAVALAAVLLAAGCDDAVGTGGLRRVEIVDGNRQTAHAGETLARPLAVRVADVFGRPAAGVAVRFRVLSGGGGVDPATAVTDAGGNAAARWRLGPVPGPGAVEVLVADAVPDTFTATSSTWIRIDVQRPIPDTVVVDYLQVRLSASHPTSQITRVSAEVDGEEVELGEEDGALVGLHPLRAMGGGIRLLRVRAYALNGDSAETTVRFEHRLPPTITILSPVPGEVVQTQVQLVATCRDARSRPCASFVAYYHRYLGDDVPYIGKAGEIRATFYHFLGSAGLLFEGIDSAGTTRYESAGAFFLDHALDAFAVEVASVDGPVFDFDGKRVLYEAYDGGYREVRIQDLHGGSSRRVLRGEQPDDGYSGRLHAHGAFIASTRNRLFDWREGELTPVGMLSGGGFWFSLALNGNWAAWPDGAGWLHRRNLADGTQDELGVVANFSEPSLAGNGDLAWAHGDGVAWLHDGRITWLHSDACERYGPDVMSAAPDVRTDGIHVAYTVELAPGCPSRPDRPGRSWVEVVSLTTGTRRSFPNAVRLGGDGFSSTLDGRIASRRTARPNSSREPDTRRRSSGRACSTRGASSSSLPTGNSCCTTRSASWRRACCMGRR